MARNTDRMDAAIVRTVRRILFGGVIILSLVLIVLWRTDNPRLERVRMSLVDATAPAISWINGPIALLTAMGRDYRNFADIYEQNRSLRREIQSLQGWRERARVLEEENARLRALNNVQLAPQLAFVTGDVIADSGGPFLQSALVNVGREDGVADGAAAVDGAGLVGRVVGLGENSARLLFLTDYSSRVPVVVQPSAQRAILTGDGTRAPVLEFLDRAVPINAGHLIETTGDGGVFPPGLPVGQVISTGPGEWRGSLFADFARLEFVRLLTYAPDRTIDQPGGLVNPDEALSGTTGDDAEQPRVETAETGSSAE